MKTEEILSTFDKLIPNPKCSLDYNNDYELLIATMLSAQSTDKRVNEVTKSLFTYDLAELANLDINKIEEIIRPVGTYHRKAIYVKRIAEVLLSDYNGKVPFDRESIEKLPGVGHKTCNVVFSEIFHEPALAVDTHVTRVSKRLGFAEESDDVLSIEQKLMKIFPREKWSRLHLQMVLFGRHFCTAKNPSCNNCPFKNKQCKNPQF